MHRSRRAFCAICAGGLFVALLVVACGAQPQADVTATIDRTTGYQTIRGWSANPHYLRITPEQRDQLLDEAVNELGLTRLRWSMPVGNRAVSRTWEWENDNGDPESINWAAFSTEYVDKFVKTYILPFKERVEANGDPFELWISPSFFDGGSTGTVPAWLLHSPGEYAEFATSFLLYLKNKFGLVATHYVICNEAGNHNAFSPDVVRRMIKTLGPKLAQLGLPTKIQFPDCVNARVSWRYIEATKDDPEMWRYIGPLTYHWYGKENQTWMAKIAQFARARGLPTGQTEYMWLKIDHLYDDLTIGGVSYWSIYGLGGPAPRQNFYIHRNGTSFSRGPQFWNFRQVMHYVRPGAVRIGARSSDPALRCLAFEREGKIVVVLINTSGPKRERSVVVANLPAGRYGVCQTVGTKPYRELGVREVGGEGKLEVTVAAGGVLTIYPHPGGNLPPTVTQWEAKPNYLTVPQSKVTLVAAACDPELDRLSFSWKVSRTPAGANVRLATPNEPTTEATGLTVPGKYGFVVAISDGTSVVRREVLLNVFSENQPPFIIDLHNRIPVQVTLPTSRTNLRAGAFDLEDDPLRFRWSIVRQPPGANARLEKPTEGACPVSNLTAPGEYVFRFEASDPTHTVSQTLTVPVYPPNNAPRILSISAAPQLLAPPQSTATLSAKTDDPDGDVITHWWEVKSAPAGANVRFERQGAATTKVFGLTAQGTYTFTLTVVDRTKFVRKDVSLVVGGQPGARPAGALELRDPPARRSRDDRVIIARGVVLGTVTAKGATWVEVTSDTGHCARYIPELRGGPPRAGGGPDRAIVAKIALLRVGQRVRVVWYVNDHLRIEDIAALP